jgi:Fe-S-cluster containining protein
MACAAGCPHCCVLNVAILLPEGMIIADRLREGLPPAALSAVQKRLATHRDWGRWMDDEERIAKLAVCPLLDDAGRCSVHPVRPLTCRGVASLDSSSCREAFNPIISDQDRMVPADLLRRAAYDEAFTALARALRRHGLDDRSIELGSGVLAFLEHPGCRGQLLSGKELPRELWG